MKEWWAGLTPEKKRLVSAGGGGSVVLVILYLFISAGPEVETLPEDLPSNTTNLLTGASPRELGLDALGNDLRANEAAVEALETRLIEQEETEARNTEALQASLEALAQQLGALSENMQAVRVDQQQQLEGLLRNVQTADDTAILEMEEIQQPGTVGPEEIIERNLFDMSQPTGAVEPASFDAPAGGGAAAGSTSVEPMAAGQVRVFGVDTAPAPTMDSPHTVYLPPGAIISGVLITGVDVPTGQLAQSDPMPALMRVKHDAILPNRYRSDVKECFIIVAAQGDLSTERALMRSESLSCVRTDRRIIEVALDGYAVGEDGKLGLRGRLVSRNGQVVAKAAAAGFAQAMSEIYRPVGIQAFNTTPGTSTIFQAPESREALSASGYAGLGGGAGQLAEYYINLADQIVPVVEVDAGRSVDLVLLEGVSLEIREA